MTPQFTTPCYMRVEDADKRKEIKNILLELGYSTLEKTSKCRPTLRKVLYVKGNKLFRVPLKDIQFICTGIDCGTNTDLFLALAGMRSDTDEGQWFFDLLGNDWICKQDNLPEKFRLGNFHRAIAAEIIEHFNNKTK